MDEGESALIVCPTCHKNVVAERRPLQDNDLTKFWETPCCGLIGVAVDYKTKYSDPGVPIWRQHAKECGEKDTKSFLDLGDHEPHVVNLESTEPRFIAEDNFGNAKTRFAVVEKGLPYTLSASDRLVSCLVAWEKTTGKNMLGSTLIIRMEGKGFSTTYSVKTATGE